MRARGQGVLAVTMVGLAILVGLGFGRLGPVTPGPVIPGQAPSGAWYCPHGGGDGWHATVFLAVLAVMAVLGLVVLLRT